MSEWLLGNDAGAERPMLSGFELAYAQSDDFWMRAGICAERLLGATAQSGCLERMLGDDV